eukprot:g42072.t1
MRGNNSSRLIYQYFYHLDDFDGIWHLRFLVCDIKRKNPPYYVYRSELTFFRPCFGPSLCRPLRKVFLRVPATSVPFGSGRSALAGPLRRFGSSPGPAPARAEGLLERYSRLLDKHPLPVKAVSSAFIVAGGDVFAQVFINGTSVTSPKYDWMRTGRMFIIGAGLIAPILHVWYNVLARYFPDPVLTAQRSPARAALVGTTRRVLLDQCVFSPLFLPVFFTGMFTLEGRLNELPDFLRAQWWFSLKANWTLWVPAQCITFSFVPLKYQVLWVNCVAFIWNTFLSWAGHEMEGHDEEPAAAELGQEDAAASATARP